jgi:hypothetical protein
MSDPLATYLNDHRAGAAGALELLEAMVERHAGRDLGRFAAQLLLRIREDSEVLDRLVETAGAPNVLKEAVAWLGEKVSRLKLPLHDEDGLGTFEALEALLLGINGKRALWQALAALDDPRVAGPDYAELVRRADEQIEQVNGCRLRLAPSALARERSRP